MAEFKYSAIVYRQRSTAEQLFCLCTATVGEIQSWARVDRLTPDNQTGVQRQRKDARVDAIQDFLSADQRNTIPTAIIVALPMGNATLNGKTPEEVVTQPVVAELIVRTDANESQPGLIIDGQHRAFGIAQFDPSTPVNLVILLGPSDDEIAFQFVVINNKVSKVSPEHIKALKLGYSDANLDARLTKSARMKSSGAPAYLDQIDTQQDSPFKGLLKWPRTDSDPKRAIPLNAFEMAMAYIASQKIDQTVASEPNPDFVVRFFLEIWKAVHESWPDLWADTASKLTRKVGIVCMTEYLVETMVAWSMAPGQQFDLTNLNVVSDLTRAVLQQQEAAFWTSEWDASSLDTKSGREWVVETLKLIQRNKSKSLPWNSKLRLLSRKTDE